MPKTNRYAVRVHWDNGMLVDPTPGLTNYQLALKKAKEFARHEDVVSAWVVTYKQTSIRKVAA